MCIENKTIIMKSDEEGYFDLQCPVEDCRGEFKIPVADYDEKIQGKMCFCPFCKAEYGWQMFPPQYLLDHEAQKAISAALGGSKRSPSKGPGYTYTPISIDIPVVEPEPWPPFPIKNKCPECGCNFSTKKVAVVCPACKGGPELAQTEEDAFTGLSEPQ